MTTLRDREGSKVDRYRGVKSGPLLTAFASGRLSSALEVLATRAGIPMARPPSSLGAELPSKCPDCSDL